MKAHDEYCFFWKKFAWKLHVPFFQCLFVFFQKDAFLNFYLNFEGENILEELSHPCSHYIQRQKISWVFLTFYINWSLKLSCYHWDNLYDMYSILFPFSGKRNFLLNWPASFMDQILVDLHKKCDNAYIISTIDSVSRVTERTRAISTNQNLFFFSECIFMYT